MSRSRRERSRWRPTTRWRHALPPGSLDRAPDGIELIRFVGSERDRDSGQPLGIFQVGNRTIRDASMDEPVRRRLAGQLRWFSGNLASPRRLSHRRDGWIRSAGGIWRRRPVAISWFKPDATVHLERMRRVAALLQELAIPIIEVRTRRPGYVTYEDAHQVVAVPFGENDAAPGHAR